MTRRRLALLIAIVLSQFVLFEAGLRLQAGSEAAPGFRALFMPDPQTGYRLRPGAETRFVTNEFTTDIAINPQGVRDRPIGPKAPGERRIVILGDSLVMAVQVPLDETFGKRLERRLNAELAASTSSSAPASGPAPASAAARVDGARIVDAGHAPVSLRSAEAAPTHYRVINAGVQGYGPVEELLFYKNVVSTFDPDLVLLTVFVGNDASEALGSAWRLSTSTHDDPPAEGTVTRLRRLARSSMVLQVARMRLQVATERVGARVPERPLKAYLEERSDEIDRGLEVARQCVQQIEALAAGQGARVGLVLMPARLQVDDADYGRLAQMTREAGGVMVRDAATTRFHEALAPLGLPMLDPLPAMRRKLPGPDLFFQSTVHLTPRGHEVMAEALDTFVHEQGLLTPSAISQPALSVPAPARPQPLPSTPLRTQP